MTHEQAAELIAQAGLVAAAREDLAKVEALLTAQPELVAAMNALTPKPGDATPQRAAAARRQLGILELFVQRGVQPDLFMACALGMTQFVDAYLQAHPKEVDAKGAHGMPLIFHVNHPPMAELLLKHGTDPDGALAQLTWSGQAELLKVALARGANVNTPKLGRKPLHIAAAQGHLAAAEFLIAAGADLNARAKGADWEFKTPMALALMQGHTAIVALLRKHVKPPPPRFAGPARPFPANRPNRPFSSRSPRR